jgi:type IV pilus assembly protein PilA
MTSNLKARLLQHFINKKKEGGFTLIELLVVIIIIGILAAIALPSFLNQANRARESEAATYNGTINRAQQAYRLENPTFAQYFNDLEAGIGSTPKTLTTIFRLILRLTRSPTGLSDGSRVDITATPRDENLHGFRGCTNATGGQSDADLVKADDVGSGKVPEDTDCF